MDLSKELVLYPNGTVSYFHKLSTDLACNYDFELMPYDRQICALQFTNTDSLENPTAFRMKEASIGSEIHMPEWEVIDYYIKPTAHSILCDEYSAVEGHISVERRRAYSLYFILLP